MAKKIKKLLSLEQLVQFCEQNKFHNFSAKDTGYTLSVQVPGNLNFSEKEDEDLLYTTVKVCHTLLNRNGSYISEENMKKAMPTLKYKPLLASIVEDENGELDFNGHDMDINDDGTIDYIEKQIGTFTVDEPYLQYDKEQDKTYVMATAVIPREYTPSASIIEKKNGTKVSCELRINEMQYNVKEKYLELTDFVFSGVCCLGESVGEGMLGSRLDITDFSTENNSIRFEENNKLVEVLEKLNTTLSNFQIDNNHERKEDAEVENEEIFEEVTEEVTETTEEVVEEVTEEVAEESTEEVAVTEETSEETTEESTEETPDVVVEESVAEVTTEETVEEVAETTETVENSETFIEDGTDDGDEDNNDEDDKENFSEVTETSESVKPSKYSIIMSDGSIKEFELTLDDITYAIFNLVNSTYGEADNTYYYVSVYENNYVIMHDYWNGKAYKQSYSREGDNFALVGDRVEVFANWLTKEEESSLNEMRANYASLVQFKADTESAELHAQREAILYDAKYSVLAEKDENNEYKNEAFAKLVSEMDNYSLTDLEKELKSVFADHITNGGQFAYAGEPEKATVTKKLFASSTSKKSSRYGNLFNK